MDNKNPHKKDTESLDMFGYYYQYQTTQIIDVRNECSEFVLQNITKLDFQKGAGTVVYFKQK